MLTIGRMLAIGVGVLVWAGLGACGGDGIASSHGAVPDRATTSVGSPAGTATPPGTAAPRPVPANLAAGLTTLPVTTTQVVIVHADRYDTTYATVETFQKTAGVWSTVFPPMQARIGYEGFSDTPAEGLSATPTGVYSFDETMYGVAPDPRFHYRYHQLVTGDYWDENPNSPSYNTFVHGSNPGGASEPLWRSPVAYSYLLVINYNVPAVAGKGSGMFMHQSLGKPTQGCVGLPRTDLLKVLGWLDPAASPRIVMGPTSALNRY
jgi:L,D-peptidoglycan transpeptidase YkuD (ErfK/YbiS/YcfS/YnhG family)